MNKNELSSELRKPFSATRGFGIEKSRHPDFGHIWFVVPPPPPRDIPKKLPVKAIGQAMGVLMGLPSFEQMDEVEKLINNLFLHREAVQSSRMEGTWSTIDDVLTPGEVFDDENASNPSALHSVRGYATSLEKLFAPAHKFKESVFTIDLICEMNRAIATRDPHFRGTPGILRTGDKDIVRIGGPGRWEDSLYNPAPPHRVKSSLKKVVDWLSDKDLAARGDAGIGGFSLVVRIAIGHSHFEAIHPFFDGNGRVGRALWPLQMICSDKMPLYLSGYVEAEREAYSTSLQASQKQLNYAPLIEFLSTAVAQSSKEATTTKASILGLPDLWKARAKFRRKSTAERTLELLIRKPVLTTAVVTKELKVSMQAANVALNQLVERKVLRKRAQRGRTQVYAAEELISVLSRSFGSDPKTAIAAGQKLIKQAEAK